MLRRKIKQDKEVRSDIVLVLISKEGLLMWWFSTDKDIVKEWAMWASDEKKKKFFKEETAGFPTKMVWSWPLVSGNQLQLSSWGLHDQTWAALTLVMEGMGCRTDHNIASPFSNRNLSPLWNKPLSSSAQSTFLKLTNETPLDLSMAPKSPSGLWSPQAKPSSPVILQSTDRT